MDVTADIVDWAPFLLSCDDGVVREYLQFLTKITRILEIDDINKLLKLFHTHFRNVYYPFLLSLLHYHSHERLDEEAEEVFVSMIVLACGDVANVRVVSM